MCIVGVGEIRKIRDVERIKEENDRPIMEIFGLEFEKVFFQEQQCEK